jgi:hypothetical protein
MSPIISPVISEEVPAEEVSFAQNVSQINIEIIDDLNTGLPIEKLDDHFATVEYSSVGESVCCICAKGFSEGDNIKMSLCGHFSHLECVTEFAIENGNHVCPQCEKSLIRSRKKSEEA